MDPITLIMTALTAGAGLGIKDAVWAMVSDAYSGLRALVKKRLGGGPEAEMIIARHEKAPQTWQAPLIAELTAAAADQDSDLLVAAQALLDLVGQGPGRAGKYKIDARGAIGVQIGDHNWQRNTFNRPSVT